MAAPRWRRAIWAPAALAVALRLTAYAMLPWADDNGGYVLIARDWLAGRWSQPAGLNRLPAAPAMFAALIAVFGNRPQWLGAAQHLVGLAAAALLVAAVLRAWGARAAAFAAWLLALEVRFAYGECFLVSEPLAWLMLAACFYCAVRAAGPRARARDWLACGLVCGLAALTRGEETVLGPVCAAALAARRLSGRQLARAAGLLAMWALPIGVWGLHNFATFGYPGLCPDSLTTLTDTALPLIRFEGGVEPEAKAVLLEQWTAARRQGGTLDPRSTTLSRLERENGYDYLRAETALSAIVREAVERHPLRYLTLTKSNFRSWLEDNLTEGAQAGISGGLLGESPAGRRLLAFERGLSRAILVLAAFGAVLLTTPRRGRWEAALAAAFFLALWAAVSLCDRPNARMQAELFLPLSLLAGYGLDGWGENFYNRVLGRRTSAQLSPGGPVHGIQAQGKRHRGDRSQHDQRG